MDSKTCSVCKKKQAKYECPRCNCKYCNSGCYKQHNTECTERFFRTHVEGSLRGKKTGSEEQKKMKQILSKFKEDDSYSFRTEAQEKRLQFLLEEKPLELTEEETKSFSTYIIHEYTLEEWSPWWENSAPHPDIQEIGHENYRYNELPSLSSLTSKPPSDSVKYYICVTLWSTAYAWRTYNGDEELIHELIGMLYALSKLNKKTRIAYQTLEDSLAHSFNKAKEFMYQDPNVILNDLHLMLEKGNLIASLFKIHDTIKFMPLRDFKSKSKTSEFVSQKIFFYMCFIKEKSSDYIAKLQEEVKSLIENN